MDEFLGDTVIALAVLDRLRRHGRVLNIRGESCRLRQKGQPGIFSSSSAILKTSRRRVNSRPAARRTGTWAGRIATGDTG